jgi:hypothetical protein
LYE